VTVGDKEFENRQVFSREQNEWHKVTQQNEEIHVQEEITKLSKGPANKTLVNHEHLRYEQKKTLR